MCIRDRSLFQPPQDKKGEFFIESPQKIFAFLMAYGPTPEELVKWMSDPQQIDRRLKGPEMMTPREFNDRVAGDGIGIKTNEMKTMIRIPHRAEAQHMQIIGDTGAGKTMIMLQILRQIKHRGDSAIVYDPAREFVKRFYDPNNGDVILNPLDKRCPYWGPSEELRRRSEAKALAVSLFQPPQDVYKRQFLP